MISTVLTKGEPLRHENRASGGYDADDDADYIAFVQDYVSGETPAGYYTVNGFADYYVETDAGERTEYLIEGQIAFEVTE